MKNLLQSLKPEYLELLDEHVKEYPNTVELFKEELSNHITWLDITFENLIFIKRVFKVEINETEIDNLFDA